LLLPLLIAVDWSGSHRRLGEWWMGEKGEPSKIVDVAAQTDQSAATQTPVYPSLTASNVADGDSFMLLGPHGLPPSDTHGAAGNGSSPQSSSTPSNGGSSSSPNNTHGNVPGTVSGPATGTAFFSPGKKGGKTPGATTPTSSSTPGTTPGGPGSQPGSGCTSNCGGGNGTPGSDGGPKDTDTPPTDNPFQPVGDTNPPGTGTGAEAPSNSVPEPGTLWLIALLTMLLAARKGFVRNTPVLLKANRS
jgi:hypothetical protein